MPLDRCMGNIVSVCLDAVLPPFENLSKLLFIRRTASAQLLFERRATKENLQENHAQHKPEIKQKKCIRLASSCLVFEKISGCTAPSVCLFPILSNMYKSTRRVCMPRILHQGMTMLYTCLDARFFKCILFLVRTCMSEPCVQAKNKISPTFIAEHVHFSNARKHTPLLIRLRTLPQR
jgi:hypothetical protein